MSVTCSKCAVTSEMKDLTIKMGGLLCPKCRVILFQPYVDEEYFEEFRRRKKEWEKEEKAENSNGGQEGS